MGRACLTFHTLRYLKFSQLFFRGYYLLTIPKIHENQPFKTRDIIETWEAPAYQLEATLDGRSFTFLGQTARIDGNWNALFHSKLWLYNLHYQDYLNAVGAENRTALLDSMVDDWIQHNPPLRGNGWEPYCISLRVVNWIKWFCRKPSSNVPGVWVRSLGTQVTALEQTIEYHILANHLFANAKALVFAGTYFAGSEGDRWLKKGLSLVDSELEEQFLSDGGHFELSPMYHSILLWDIADLINLARISSLPELVERAAGLKAVFAKGLSWLESMTHPDGDIAFFNDSTLGVGPTIDELSAYARLLDVAIPNPSSEVLSGIMLSESGYCSLNLYKDSKLIADVGRVGPDYQPGHAHADTLSCELSLHGQRVFVNSGISQYGEGTERIRQRSTAAHNTVEVDGENSSEVWAGFRVARRAYPVEVNYSETDNCIHLSAGHSGFRRLKSEVTHHRTWEARDLKLQVTDRLEGHYQRALGFWHLHPNIDASLRDSSTIDLALSSGQTVVLRIAGAELSLEETTWHPGFGKSIISTRIVFKFLSPIVVTEILWTDA